MRRPPRFEIQMLAALALLVAALAAMLAWQRADGQQIAHASTPSERIRVTSVHDGDTFRIGSERIRVLGMDAPEIGDGAQCANEQRMAEQARDYLRRALNGQGVSMARDGHDVYGRTLARVYVEGRDIASAMIKAGLAKPYVRGRHGNWC